jgi:transposase
VPDDQNHSLWHEQYFKQYSQGQICMFPRSLDEKIPENAPVRLVSQIVDNLDISEITNSYVYVIMLKRIAELKLTTN